MTLRMSSMCMWNIRRMKSPQQVPAIKAISPHCRRRASLNCTQMPAPIRHSSKTAAWRICWGPKNDTRRRHAPTSTQSRKLWRRKCEKSSPSGLLRWERKFYFHLTVSFVLKRKSSNYASPVPTILQNISTLPHSKSNAVQQFLNYSWINSQDSSFCQ